MKKIAKFEKVSESIFTEAMIKQNLISENDTSAYDDIKLPCRATKGSAGYDFFAPVDITIPSGYNSIVVPTGIRCKIDEGYMLSMFPRSGLGFKHRVALDNTVGIIDQDYYFSDNEGHVMIKLHTNLNEPVVIKKGAAFVQGILLEYHITIDDEVTETRNGGFGSTSK